MWKAHCGEDANLDKLIPILETRDKDCAAQLKKTFAVSPCKAFDFEDNGNKHLARELKKVKDAAEQVLLLL